ncbi:MAG: thioredoxin family protein [Acidimicrobiaceae bacterium]|nr:thioredoxin family protein [Acidimicrobiaceae bacterium]
MVTPPPLSAGLVAFVKRDCETCKLVDPVLGAIAKDEPLTVYTQDDVSFPTSVAAVDDLALEMSWHHNIETVPTLIRVDANGVEEERIVGWSRDQWQAFTGNMKLGITLPGFRPGCGSLSVDPSRADELNARMGGSGLVTRRVDFAELEDDFEAMYDRGWSDGLPLVPPTEARVMRMLEGTTRSASDIVANVAPDLIDVTVEKIAVNAVMAGCKPEYLPVVIAAVEAICTDEFNIHGLLATTMSVGPVFVVNGPIRKQLGMNSGINVFGQGNRANLTIGRAVQLIVRNVGGGRPGGVDRATQGSPAKIGLAFPEDEEGTPWISLAEERGMEPGVNAITALCLEGPRLIVDQLSRTPESLTNNIAECLMTTHSKRMVYGIDALLVLSPEHMSRYVDAGWDRAQFRAELEERLMVNTDDIIRGTGGIDEGLPADFAGMQLPKFRPGGLHIAHAGGPAGLFSSVFAGWVSGEKGSVPVTKEITP